MLPRVQVRWVNTIGMRTPRFDLATMRRGAEKLLKWTNWRTDQEDRSSKANPTVLNPRMWPRFRRGWERRLNRRLLESSLTKHIQSESVALTTVPIVADLVGRLPMLRWVYYRVDDFAAWPGHDADTVASLERDLIQRVDRIVVAGENLRGIVEDLGRSADVLTHGVDLEFWSNPTANAAAESAELERPVILFWGLIDQRLDVEMVAALAHSLDRGTIMLVGPEQESPRELNDLRRVIRCGAVSMSRLPALAAAADVLVMPYIDSPVTRAMQPLKLKEYLATGKPVVATDLPAVREWADCLDVATESRQFVKLVQRNCADGIAPAQFAARRRLRQESWQAKSDRLYEVLFQDL